VFISASFDQRVHRYAKRSGSTTDEASAILAEIDKEQARFVKFFSGKELLDTQYYDVIANTDKLSPVSIAKIIYRAFDQIEHPSSSDTR